MIYTAEGKRACTKQAHLATLMYRAIALPIVPSSLECPVKKMGMTTLEHHEQ